MKRRTNSTKQPRTTFREIVEESRGESAVRAWQRALVASRLCHAMLASRRHRAAYILSEITSKAIERVVSLLQHEAGLTTKTHFQVAPSSIRRNGRIRLNVPAAALPRKPVDTGEREAGCARGVRLLVAG
jgi:exonuclease VII small subunit